jgi:MYXO-CTERM domain-containing protein
MPDAGMPPIMQDAGLAPGGKLGGAGFSCQLSPRGSQPSAAGFLSLLGLAASLRWRRRTRRQHANARVR